MEHLKNSITLRVRVPVLSDNTVCIDPNSSLRLDVRARANIPDAGSYIEGSRLISSMQDADLMTSNVTYSDIGIKNPYRMKCVTQL